jgi:hypothetical protein
VRRQPHRRDEQVDCVRRLLFDDIAERAEYLSGSAKDAAERLNNVMPIDDARLSLRLIAESVAVFEQLGWGADAES